MGGVARGFVAAAHVSLRIIHPEMVIIIVKVWPAFDGSDFGGWGSILYTGPVGNRKGVRNCGTSWFSLFLHNITTTIHLIRILYQRIYIMVWPFVFI